MQLYLGKGCQIANKDNRKRSMTIPSGQFEIPKSHIVVIHCADVKHLFQDVIQV